MSDQKTAIVTGASRGIGAGLVEAFLKQGYNVVATSRDVGQSLTASLTANGVARLHSQLKYSEHLRRRESMSVNVRIGCQARKADCPQQSDCRHDAETVLRLNIRFTFNPAEEAVRVREAASLSESRVRDFM